MVNRGDRILPDLARAHANAVNERGKRLFSCAQKAKEASIFTADKAGPQLDWQEAVAQLHNSLDAVADRVSNYGEYTVSLSKKMHKAIDELVERDERSRLR